jgi:hypothetical protein
MNATDTQSGPRILLPGAFYREGVVATAQRRKIDFGMSA